MDAIFQIIKTFKKEEVRSFKLFTQRYATLKENKIVVLFDKIRSNQLVIDEKELNKTLFPESPENSNAYYRLKFRLKQEVEKALLDFHHDIDVKISMMNDINLANIFTYKSTYDLSLSYLKKAEKIAEKYEFYDILEIIYNEIIALSHNFDEINPFEYIQKFKENKTKKDLSQEIDQAIATVRYRLKQTNFSKAGEEIENKLKEIVEDLQIAGEIYQTPKVKLRIHITIRDLLLHDNDFKGLEKYLIDSLEEFENSGFFSKFNHPSKINLITWIINTLNINKKYSSSLQYTERLFEELNKYGKVYYDQYIWTYYQSLIANYMSSGNLTSAIELLERIKELPAHKGVTFYDYAIYVNLTLCYYFEEKKSAGIKTLGNLLQKETFNKLSSEHQLSILMLEAILHYDNNNLDYVDYRLSDIKNKYRTLLKKDVYKDEKDFIKIMFQVLQSNTPFRDKNIQQNIKIFNEKASSLQIGSNKHIDYKLWFQSKLEKKPYYSLLLNTLN
jgi:tetratricopeptide (TPR) repeat protein